MSTDQSVQAENAALSEKIDAIEQDTEALGRAMSQSRRLRLVILTSLLALTLIFSYLFVNLGKKFTEPGKQKEFASLALGHYFDGIDHQIPANLELEQQLEEYQKIALKELEELGRDSAPIVEAAFREQFGKDMSKYRAMMAEQRELLTSNLKQRADDVLQARYQEILKQHEHLLAEEFEDLDDAQKERILVNFNIAFDQLLNKYYRKEIEQQFNELQATFNRFPVADPSSGEITLRQQLLGTTVETLNVKLVGESQPIAFVADASGIEIAPVTEVSPVAEATPAPKTTEAKNASETSDTPVVTTPAATPETAASSDAKKPLADARLSAEKSVTEKPVTEKPVTEAKEAS